MLLQKESSQSQVSIKDYRDGKLKVSGNWYSKPLLLSSTEVDIYSDASCLAELNVKKLLPLLPQDTEILLIGSGQNHQFLSAEQTQTLNQAGIAVEIMATRPAAHTFEVLVYDKRRISALLFL